MNREKQRQARARRLAAAAAGAMHYSGLVCRKCQGTERYVSTGACVPCTKHRAITSQREMRAALAQARAEAP